MEKDSTLHIAVDSIATSSNWVDVLSALLVPVVAIAGVIIAYQQYKINQQRLKHELYERRLVIFKHMKTYLSEIMREGTVTYDRALKFNYDVAESTFLVDDKINKRIKEIYEKSIDMAMYHERMYPSDGSQGLPISDERSRIAHEHGDLLKWMSDQLVELKPLFEKHLGLS